MPDTETLGAAAPPEPETPVVLNPDAEIIEEPTPVTTEAIDPEGTPYEVTQDGANQPIVTDPETGEETFLEPTGDLVKSEPYKPVWRESWSPVQLPSQGGRHQHGGLLRKNEDGSVTFRPTSYVGADVTAPTREDITLP